MTKKKRKKKPQKKPVNLSKKTDANVSEAIVSITNSFIEENPEFAELDFKQIVQFSVVAWNMSLFQEMSREELYVKIAKILSKDVGTEVIGSFVSMVELLMDKKKKHYPDVNRLIKKHKVREINGDMRLDVKSSPFGEERN